MRISSIDYFKVVAILAVISIHTEPFYAYSGDLWKYLKVFINQGARFAVPFFYVTAGYLWAKKVSTGASVEQVSIKYGTRILSIFVFWSVVYIFVPTNIHAIQSIGFPALIKVPCWRILNLFDNPVVLLFQGSKVHLWFLVSMLYALAITSILLKFNLKKWLIPLGLLLYAFGLIAGSYSTTPIGFKIHFNTRNGPFLATIFFVFGWWLSLNEERVSLRLSLTLMVTGFTLHMMEAFFLWRLFDVPLTRHDYLLGTLPFGVGVAMVALSRPSFGENTIIAKPETIIIEKI